MPKEEECETPRMNEKPKRKESDLMASIKKLK
jgi:hypothetical protein